MIAPKLARRPVGPKYVQNSNSWFRIYILIVPISCFVCSSDESRDEPWAWEAREFLRQKLIGEEVYFYSERPPNATRDYGVIYLGPDANTSQNVTELLISEGLVSVRRDNRSPNPEQQKLYDLEDAAKASGKGKWGSSSAADHVRNIKWTQDNLRNFVEETGGKPVKAIIEHVRDGSTVRAFLLPEFQYITLMISGIRVSILYLKNGQNSYVALNIWIKYCIFIFDN